MNDKTENTCHKCNYTWPCGSDKKKVTCPSCLSKTDNRRYYDKLVRSH